MKMVNFSNADISMFNIIVLGLAFMFTYTSFSTASMSEQSILEGIHNETNGTFSGSGYVSLAIVYAAFAVSTWITPMIVVWAGVRVSMFLSSISMALFTVSFLKPMEWSLYLVSAIVGFGSAVIWTAEGFFLSLNSDKETVGRNSGIFYALFQGSLFFGNIYQYFAFKGQVILTSSSCTEVMLVLTGSAVIGSLFFLGLQRPPDRSTECEPINVEYESETLPPPTPSPQIPIEAFKHSFSLVRSKRMLLMLLPFAFTGFESTFLTGVYGTCLGHTRQFGNVAKSYIGLSGIFIGLGEIGGGLFTCFVSKHLHNLGRESIVLIGYVSFVVGYFLIFLMLPTDSPHAETDGVAYIRASVPIAMICGVLLGWGDCLYQTQLTAYIGDVYSHNDNLSAFAIYNFMQTVSNAIAFVYSSILPLQWQLLILVVMATVGALSYIWLERETRALVLTVHAVEEEEREILINEG